MTGVDDFCSQCRERPEEGPCPLHDRLAEHHPNCYQRVGVPESLPADLCDCRVLQMLDTTKRDEVRETYAAMRARVPQHDIKSARHEFDEWFAREVAQAKAEALQAQARQFRDVAGGSWGGSERWLTTGANVADLVAGWCEEAALDYLGSGAQR